jgi:hypothetical protein
LNLPRKSLRRKACQSRQQRRIRKWSRKRLKRLINPPK